MCCSKWSRAFALQEWALEKRPCAHLRYHRLYSEQRRRNELRAEEFVSFLSRLTWALTLQNPNFVVCGVQQGVITAAPIYSTLKENQSNNFPIKCNEKGSPPFYSHPHFLHNTLPLTHTKSYAPVLSESIYSDQNIICLTAKIVKLGFQTSFRKDPFFEIWSETFGLPRCCAVLLIPQPVWPPINSGYPLLAQHGDLRPHRSIPNICWFTGTSFLWAALFHQRNLET